MQFVHTPYFSGYTNASQQQALQQQQQQPQQQQQQQQQQNSPHASQSPAPSAAQVDQQQQHQQQQPQPLGMPTALPGFAQAGIPVASAGTELNAQGKPKRKQVKNACVNCQKACKKCDDGRPCQRCVKYGLQDTCVNSVRKERKKGIKRGPYKKRKQGDGSSSTDGSTTSAQNVSGTTSLPGALYAQTSQAPSAVRTNGVLAYQPFQSGGYDAFHAAVSYQNSSMMPHAYMVPAMQQMYPNQILSYQAAMSMLSPQHGQSSPNVYGFRQDNTQQSSDQQADGQQQQQQPQQPQQQHHRSHEGSPATPTGGVSTPNIKSENATATESDDEGSKLNILSQLCSAVLDRSPAEPVKQEEQSSQNPEQTQTQQDNQQHASPAVGGEATSSLHQSTPPPSRDHSREVSNEADVKSEGASN